MRAADHSVGIDHPQRGGRRSSDAAGRDAPARALTVPVAALLLGPASVLALMARNLNQTSFSDVAPWLAATVGFAALVWLVVAGLMRRLDGRAALGAAAWTAGALFYLGLFGGLNRWLDGGYPMVRSLPVALGLLALVTLLVWRMPAALAGALHAVASVTALVLLAAPLWAAVAYEWRDGAARDAYDADRAAAMLGGPPSGAMVRGAGRPPDIFHLVFDRYGSAETLRDVYGIETWIGDHLEAQGFNVASESHSNYLKTAPSLASTFHMDYLDEVAADARVAPDSWHPMFEMLDDHRVGRFLRMRGYRLIQFGSWWAGTFDSDIADENHPLGFSEFGMLYLRRTMLRPVLHALPDVPPTGWLDWDNAQCQRVPRQVERIKAISEGAQPVHVFAHILVPHGPYVFTPDGDCLTQAAAGRRGERQGYVDQIAYADLVIRDVVSTLLARDPPPVILIHADEGPFPERDGRIPWHEAPADVLRIKTGILNAVYLPGGEDALSPRITPVNLYRAVFNATFGTAFPLLPDRIYAFPDEGRLYELHDVSDRLR